jgi:peptidoglycan/xylan/chitin deacetylase (PgdA/CDA1 family)
MANQLFCALTFDDGPDPRKTPLVLERLERFGIPASFFMIGRRIMPEAYPAVQRVLDLGCEIGNHSWSWEPMDAMEPAAVLDSLNRTDQAIMDRGAPRPAFFRPPNLALSPALFKAVDRPFAGGITAQDWSGCGTGAEERAALILSAVRDGAIILLHDSQPDPHPTPEALDILIPALQARGYAFLTLSGLFERKGVDPASRPGEMWTFVE